MRPVLGAAFAAVAITAVSGVASRSAPHANAAPAALTASAASMARAHHLTTIMGCATCHAANFGGALAYNDPSSVVLWAPNLTRGRGGFLANHGAPDFARALQHGIGPDGKKLLVMPSWDYAGLSRDDVAAIYAYVRSRPPVDRVTPKAVFGPKAPEAIAAGLVRYDADRLARSPVPHLDSTPAVSPAYGAYLVRIVGCEGCHGPQLTGSPPGVPVGAPPLTPNVIGSWTAANFVTTIRTGNTPAGGSLGDVMPWREFAHMTDDELHADLRLPEDPAAE